ncbi:LacI family DNA-binding transcriptional regulator [Streptacidiphilus sp. EB103A]|jgi:LacI family transcriptional regulator|uniref:LacI family DNA-binding transcriptional regulator n=1 Tax=Streptacidiphilus sp. EB103A TaxID=3156275 RepID=UPI003518C677
MDAVSINDVAEQAGVSKATVSNVINRPDLVASKTRVHVQAVIDQLGYVRSESARHLSAGSSRMMAVLVLDMTNPYFVDVAYGAEQEGFGAGFGVMVCNSRCDDEVEAQYLAMFAEQRVRAVLLTPSDSSGRNLEALRRRRVPFVLVDPQGDDGRECSVTGDYLLGGTLAVRHLIATGHREIAYVFSEPRLSQVSDRHAGALAALAEAGLPPENLVCLPTERMDVACGRDAGARLLGLSRRPTAVFCANDLLALGVLQAAYAAGLRVPQDLAIVGYDDISFAAAAAVPLTSVRQPAAAMGALAARLILEEAGSGPGEHTHRQVVVPPELVVRESSMSRH